MVDEAFVEFDPTEAGITEDVVTDDRFAVESNLDLSPTKPLV
jgi:hypothetical protein